MHDWFTSPVSGVAAVERSAEAQRLVDAATARLALYHYDSCMYCARVRAVMQRLRLDIELRDILREARHRRELMQGGGRGTVPCLRIDDAAGDGTQWLYESADIIDYLVERFGAATTPDV